MATETLYVRFFNLCCLGTMLGEKLIGFEPNIKPTIYDTNFSLCRYITARFQLMKLYNINSGTDVFYFSDVHSKVGFISGFNRYSIGEDQHTGSSTTHVLPLSLLPFDKKHYSFYTSLSS